MKKLIACLLFIFINAHAKIAQIPFHNTLFDKQCCLNITHAGGSIEGFAYTNSKEALDANYALGRRVFELDFNKTKDQHWVLTHGWKQWAHQVGYAKPLGRFEKLTACFEDKPPKAYRPTLAEFVSKKWHHRFTPMTLSDLASWVAAHPDTTVIVDVWSKDLPELYAAMHRYPNLLPHLIFQTYHPEDIALLKSKNIPTSRMIFSNYQALLSNENLIALIKREGLGAVTVNIQSALSNMTALKKALPDTPIYVHGKPNTINALEVQYRLMQNGASGFYLE